MTAPKHERIPLRPWYHVNFPDDDLYSEIRTGTTFQGLFEALDHYRDVYEYIGVEDSIVRERLFQGLAALTGYSYDDIYYQWLQSAATHR